MLENQWHSVNKCVFSIHCSSTIKPSITDHPQVTAVRHAGHGTFLWGLQWSSVQGWRATHKSVQILCHQSPREKFLSRRDWLVFKLQKASQRQAKFRQLKIKWNLDFNIIIIIVIWKIQFWNVLIWWYKVRLIKCHCYHEKKSRFGSDKIKNFCNTSFVYFFSWKPNVHNYVGDIKRKTVNFTHCLQSACHLLLKNHLDLKDLIYCAQYAFSDVHTCMNGIFLM